LSGFESCDGHPFAAARRHFEKRSKIGREYDSSLGIPRTPRPAVTLVSTCGAPPAMSMRFSLPSAKNPTDALSGDQNGYDAPSVPGSSCAATESNGRSQSWDLLSWDAKNTRLRPSGEIANDVGSSVEGVLTSTRISGGVARLK